jgi:endonuclease YncB( thermonuclease family)
MPGGLTHPTTKGTSLQTSRRIIGVITTAAVIGGAAVVIAPGAQAAPSSTVTWTTAKVVRWVDGDTVVTSRGTVRIIGLDTPEVGTRGAAAATRVARTMAPKGTRIRLGNPVSVSNRDGYGRLLRYVKVGDRDVAARQIVKGAKARYDGRDGYQWHPRQTRYRALDSRFADYPTGAASTGGVVPSQGRCPASAPIKGNQGSPEWIYHMPGQRFYGVTYAEQCFATRAAAERAGYRAAKV